MIWADTITGTHDKNHPTVPVSIVRSRRSRRCRRLHGLHHHAHDTEGKGVGLPGHQSDRAGVMLVAALLVLLGHAAEQAAVGVVPPMVAGVFLGITGVLLIADLKQPTRFHYLLTRGNTDSWLVKGAYVLMFFAAMRPVVDRWPHRERRSDRDRYLRCTGRLGTAGYTGSPSPSVKAAICGRPRCCFPCCSPRPSPLAVPPTPRPMCSWTCPSRTPSRVLPVVSWPAAPSSGWNCQSREPPCRARRRDDDPRPVRPTVLGRWDHGRLVVPGAINILVLATDISSPAPLAAAASPYRRAFAYEDARPQPASSSLSPDRLLAES